MKLSYEYNNQKIQLSVEFRKRKTLAIHIDGQINQSSMVRVIAPFGVSKEKIIEIVRGKSAWIIKKQAEILEREQNRKPREFVEGEILPFMGKDYKLRIIVDGAFKKPEVHLIGEELVVHVPASKISAQENENTAIRIRNALEKWYKENASRQITERVEFYQSYFPVKPTKIIVKNQQKRWGSCNQKRELRFNWKIIMAPSTALDYLVVHEMCHMVHMNHSKDFWKLVEKSFPDFRQGREHLKRNGAKYFL